MCSPGPWGLVHICLHHQGPADQPPLLPCVQHSRRGKVYFDIRTIYDSFFLWISWKYLKNISSETVKFEFPQCHLPNLHWGGVTGCKINTVISPLRYLFKVSRFSWGWLPPHRRSAALAMITSPPLHTLSDDLMIILLICLIMQPGSFQTRISLTPVSSVLLWFSELCDVLCGVKARGCPLAVSANAAW